MSNTHIWWSAVANLGAMIDGDAEIQVWCNRCGLSKNFTKDELIALAETVGRDFSLKNRRCRCRLSPDCDGWNSFCYRRGVYRPLSDPEMTLIRMCRDWDESMERLARFGSRSGPAIDSVPDGMDDPAMCNRYKPGERKRVTDLFSAKVLRQYNDGPTIVHPRDPGPVVRIHEGEMTLEQMTWGFPVVLQGKRGQPLKPRPVNNARFDKLGKFWKRWAENPAQRCLIPTASYAEAVGEPRQMTCTWLSLKSMPVFAWAGLWSVSEEWGPVYTGVMTDNAPELSDIHDRSPVILAPEDWQTWLTAPLPDLYQFDRAWPADDVQVDATEVLWKHGGQNPSTLV